MSNADKYRDEIRDEIEFYCASAEYRDSATELMVGLLERALDEQRHGIAEQHVEDAESTSDDEGDAYAMGYRDAMLDAATNAEHYETEA